MTWLARAIVPVSLMRPLLTWLELLTRLLFLLCILSPSLYFCTERRASHYFDSKLSDLYPRMCLSRVHIRVSLVDLYHRKIEIMGSRRLNSHRFNQIKQLMSLFGLFNSFHVYFSEFWCNKQDTLIDRHNPSGHTCDQNESCSPNATKSIKD